MIAFLIVSYFVYKAYALQGKMELKGSEGSQVAKVTSAPEDADAITILLVGTDRRPEWKTGRADSLNVLRLYPKENLAYLLSIPRDARVEVPGRGQDKINYSYTLGGPALLIETVENLLDLDVNYYAQVDYVTFQKVVDAIGGVEYYIDKGWYSGEFKVQVRQGTHRRSGIEALADLKSRTFAMKDVQRVRHQQEFLTAAAKQLINSPAQMPQVAEVIADNSKTNMKLTDMYRIGKAFGNKNIDLQVAALPGSAGLFRGVAYAFIDRKAKDTLVSQMKRHESFDLKAR